MEGRKRISSADFANEQRPRMTFWRTTGLKLPLGYAYAAAYAGIRQVEKDDLALIVSGLPANAAAVSQNRVQAAPVRLGQNHLKASRGWLAQW
jgi:N-acetylglutamate synthase/N-acetylornithine aminotransferase